MVKTNFVRTLLIQRCFESLGCLPPKIQRSTTRRRSTTISVHNEQNGGSLSKDSYECVDHILKPALNLTWREKRVISLELYILILAIGSLISFHHCDIDVIMIKVTSHKPQSNHMVESYHQIKFKWPRCTLTN